MQPFAYQAPTSVGEAVALLADPARQARPFAGGTDLLVQMRRGVFAPEMLVDVKHIPELNRIAFDPVEGLTVGAAVSCAWLCDHPACNALTRDWSMRRPSSAGPLSSGAPHSAAISATPRRAATLSPR